MVGDPYIAAEARTFGWGAPSSGAVAMSAAWRATPRSGVWKLIRDELVERQLGEALGDGELTFQETYACHVQAYADHAAGPFIDRAHFFLATHVTPLLDRVGLDSTWFTRWSILVFNNPEDPARAAWLKRTLLGLVEVALIATAPIGAYALFSNTRAWLRWGGR